MAIGSHRAGLKRAGRYASAMIGAGYVAVCAAAVLWAAGGAVASHLIDRGADFIQLTEARAWISALVLVATARTVRAPAAPRARAPVWLVVVFGLSIAACNFLYYLSLSRLPVAVAITVQYTGPGLVVLWTSFAQRQAPSRRMIASLLAAMLGVALLAELPVLISLGKLNVDALGLFAAGSAAITFATYMVTGEHVGKAYGARGSVMRGFLVASALWVVVQAVRGRPDTLLDAEFIPGVLFLAVATTIAPFVLFVWGLSRVRVSDASVVSTLEPLTAAFIAFVWLGQRLSAWQLAGGLLVVIGIGLVQAERPLPAEVLEERAAVD
jgi:drug/metabolite transporter (DMT)-like permease